MSARHWSVAVILPLALIVAACSGSTPQSPTVVTNGPSASTAASVVSSAPPSGASCPGSPATVATGASLVFAGGCNMAVLVLPARWVLQVGSASDGECEIGVEQPDGRVRSVYGSPTLVHGRTGGQYKLSSKRPCTISVMGADDDVRSLPLQIAPTSRSGATPVFDVPSPGFRAHITGDPEKCNATVLRDSGEKLNRATPAKDFVGQPGRYYIETEVDGCTLAISAL